MAEQKFKSGDRVRLMTGGMIMTVENSVLSQDRSDYLVNCAWFVNNDCKKEKFYQGALELSKKPTDDSLV